MQEPPSSLAAILARRREYGQLLMVAVVLAVGVNLLTNAISEITLVRQHATVAALIACGIALGWLLVVTFSTRLASFEYRAALLFDVASRRIRYIPDYWFNELVMETLNAVFAEDTALREIWDNDPLPGLGETDDPTAMLVEGYYTESMPIPDLSVSRSAQLLRETLECVLLDELSLHVSDHCYEVPHGEQYVRTYERHDLPRELLDNRVLALLTTPYEHRPSFVAKQNTLTRANAMFAFSPDGAIYNHLQLVLPRGTSIERLSQGHIKLSNRRIELKLQVVYEAEPASQPMPDFVEMALGVPHQSVRSQLVTVHLKYRVKPFALLFRSGWQYYEWVDSFAKRFTDAYDFLEYLRRTNWETVRLQTQVFKNVLGITRDTTVHRAPRDAESAEN